MDENGRYIICKSLYLYLLGYLSDIVIVPNSIFPIANLFLTSSYFVLISFLLGLSFVNAYVMKLGHNKARLTFRTIT